ncbi:MAG: hypothetical protein ACRESP_14000, partial [Pseudomonas sp.]
CQCRGFDNTGEYRNNGQRAFRLYAAHGRILRFEPTLSQLAKIGAGSAVGGVSECGTYYPFNRVGLMGFGKYQTAV